ncbi:MAG: hypothetical protein ACI4TY_00300 [Candidatus Limosilactobacillus intestinavium]
MEYWQYLLVIAAAVVLLLAVRSAVIKRRKRLERDFARKLETLVQPKETVKVVCPNAEGRWVLTSRRLLIETKEGFMAIPFSKIKQLKGVDAAGKTTVSPTKMTRLTVKTDQEYTLRNTSKEFADLAKQLKAKTTKKTGAQKPKGGSKCHDSKKRSSGS